MGIVHGWAAGYLGFRERGSKQGLHCEHIRAPCGYEVCEQASYERYKAYSISESPVRWRGSNWQQIPGALYDIHQA